MLTRDKNSTYSAFWGNHWGSYHPVVYIFRKLCLRATFASQRVCLYLEPLKISSLKVYDARKIRKNATLCGRMGAPLGNYRPVLYILKSSRRADVKL